MNRISIHRISVLVAVFGLAVGVGCADVDDEDPSPDDTDETQLGLTVDFVGDTDVAGFDYTIAECSDQEGIDDSKIVKQQSKDLEDLSLPGMIPEFDNDPFDEDSTHLFADYYTSLPAGCYDVEVQPITKSGEPSDDCDAALDEGVHVEEGKTTEALLISQCDGADRGGLDVVAALNHPPKIHELKFSKFNHECDRVKICATASDPDGDPVEFEWKQIGGPDLVEEMTPKGDKSISCDSESCQFGEYDDYIRSGHQKVDSCVEMKLGEAGDYKFKLGVYDLYWEDDKLVRFPDSSATMTFPVYAASKPDIKCPPKETKKGY